MSKIRYFLAFSSIALAACESEPRTPEPPRLDEAFSHLPLPPDPVLIAQSGSDDALQLTIRSPVDLPQVAKYYRTTLTQGNWRLVSDMENPDGSTSLYAEHDGPPLWVRIWKSKDQPGTMVQLTGAVVARDSVAQPGRADSLRKPAS